MAEGENSGRFWWLWHNKFYETTVLTGYAFINDSKRKSEALFWYAIIIVLAIFTINNVTKLANHYRSQPTRTEVRITSNAMDATIGNFSIKLKLPMTEIQSQKPLASWNDRNIPLSCSCSCYGLEEQSESFDPSYCLPVHLISLIKTYNPEYVPDFLEFRDYCKITSDPLNRTFTGVVETEQMFRILNDRFSEKLDGIWSKIAKNDNSSFVEKFQDAAQVYNALMDETVEQNFMTQFLLLKIMSDETIGCCYLPFVEHFDATEFFKFSPLSPKETVDRISSRLFDIAPFVVTEPLSETEFFVRDWNVQFVKEITYLNTNNWYSNTNNSAYRKFGSDFTIEFQVQPPDGVSEFSMDINLPKQLIKFLFPFMHFDMWLHHLGMNDMWLAFEDKDLIDEKQEELISIIYHLTSCDIEDWSDDIDLFMSHEQLVWLSHYFNGRPRTDFLENVVYPAIEFYREHSEVELKLGSGVEHLTLKPFYHYHINQLPIGRVVSQTDDCISMKLATCLDSCQGNYTIEKCRCYPWNLHYLHSQSDVAVCLEPCPGLTEEKVECISKCEQLLAHPCDQFIFRPEIEQFPIAYAMQGTQTSTFNFSDLEEGYDLAFLLLGLSQRLAMGEEFKLFKFRITIERVMTYVKTLESYEMSFTNLISEFGGLVDFWLGVNLIGIIHAIVHFLKQCCHCNREHKTGRTMRQLVACTNNNAVRPNGEQSEILTHASIEAMMQQQIDRCLIQIDRKIEEKIVKEIKKQKKRKKPDDRLRKF